MTAERIPTGMAIIQDRTRAIPESCKVNGNLRISRSFTGWRDQRDSSRSKCARSHIQLRNCMCRGALSPNRSRILSRAA